jgi:mRNA-degrading endonuclease toxin of MazEF toxin-antitoxin module
MFNGTKYITSGITTMIEKGEENNLLADSVAYVNQIMTFDKQHVVKAIAKVSSQHLSELYQRIAVHFGEEEL